VVCVLPNRAGVAKSNLTAAPNRRICYPNLDDVIEGLTLTKPNPNLHCVIDYQSL
jgi:hypothetical protein